MSDSVAIFVVKDSVPYSYRKSHYRSNINSTWEVTCGSVLMLTGSGVYTSVCLTHSTYPYNSMQHDGGGSLKDDPVNFTRQIFVSAFFRKTVSNSISTHFRLRVYWSHNQILKPLAPELFFFLISAHPVYKMRIIQEPNQLALWNKLHFEEKKTDSIEHV